MTHSPTEQVNIFLNFEKKTILVGRLAQKEQTIYFEYDANFIQSDLEISPFKLPLKSGLQRGDLEIFDGLPGVFNDSLPDGWGRLLLDRSVKSKGILPGELTPLDRLCYVGEYGMGALTYEPATNTPTKHTPIDLDALAQQAKTILQGQPESVLNEMLELNGSSAGARPKAMIGLSTDKKSIIHGIEQLSKTHDYWLVKFINSSEDIDSGAIEYVYSEMAKLAGIEMMDTCLLPANIGPGYFATQRFDRTHTNRFHIHTACGLLHSNFRTPSLDYHDLAKATLLLTKNKEEVIKLYRLAVFNVLAHNQDDHSKNISFIMNTLGEWKLAPAYDLTFSSGPGGEQSTMVMGVGRNITIDKLIELGNTININQKLTHEIIDETRSALSKWKLLAKNAQVFDENINFIQERLTL